MTGAEFDDGLVNPAVALARFGDVPATREPPRRTIFVVLILLAVLTGLATFAPAAALDPARYSAWGSAVQAFGTVMAFAATTAALAWHWLTERENTRYAIEVERRSQAVRIHGWLATTEPETGEEIPPFLVVVENRVTYPSTRRSWRSSMAAIPANQSSGPACTIKLVPPLDSASIQAAAQPAELRWRDGLASSATGVVHRCGW